MKKLEMVCFDENGQGFIDWDALEVVTSVDFVEVIKQYMDDLEEFSPIIISSKNRDIVVEVIVYDSLKQVKFFKFFKEDSFISEKCIWLHEIEQLVNILGGEISWLK